RALVALMHFLLLLLAALGVCSVVIVRALSAYVLKPLLPPEIAPECPALSWREQLELWRILTSLAKPTREKAYPQIPATIMQLVLKTAALINEGVLRPAEDGLFLHQPGTRKHVWLLQAHTFLDLCLATRVSAGTLITAPEDVTVASILEARAL